MKTAIVQYDSRGLQGIGALSKLCGRNQVYAQNWNFSYFFLDNIDIDIPPYWVKPHAVAHFLRMGFESVLWIDTDAVIHKLDVSINELWQEGVIFVCSGDPPIWTTPWDFNAGVFLVRGKDGLGLMQKWASLYDRSLWIRTPSGWECKDKVWAGLAYEQGSFGKYLLPHYMKSGQALKLPWTLLQSPYPVAESLVVHFASEFKQNALIYMHYFRFR